jgi:signal transduction histidine kinase
VDARARAAAAIAEAQSDLDRALEEIDAIQTFNPMLVGLVAHSLSNYITVTAATVEMLQLTLRDHPSPDVTIWLEGIGHTTDLMQHTVSRLVAMSVPRDFPLKLERVNIRVLMDRACEYYRRRTASQHLRLTCDAEPVPLVSGDRVALAVVADNLLGNAVRVSKPRGTIRVTMTGEPGAVACTITDAGPGLTKEQVERLFRAPLTQPVSPGPEHAGTYAVALADEYLRRMGGELECESEPGVGTSFTFRVPAAD